MEVETDIQSSGPYPGILHGNSEQTRSSASEPKSEGEELDLQTNPVEDSLNDCESD